MMKSIAAVLVFILAAAVCADDARPTVRPVRVETPPRIDGVLDDPVWSAVEPITDFRQREPADGEAASERTEVRICYDSHSLYIGVRVLDSDSSRLVRTIFERDGNVGQDDSLEIYIDSNGDGRTAFRFATNANGARAEAETGDFGVFNESWDAIWTSRAHVDAEGYTLEIAIPFFVLRFRPAEEVEMGLLVSRTIRRKNEFVCWPYIERDFMLTTASRYGRLAGLRGIERGKAIEIKPYAIAGHSRTATASEFDGDAGLDVKWGITPNLTADFTLNTDFAQVESDALQVNLTRFSLFYPEKRPFFIEGADLFHFGLYNRAEIFFSRRIGLRGNREVPIIGGARLHGLVGDTNVGFLSMQTAESGGIGGENFTVAMAKHNIFRRSYVGGIVTRRSGVASEEDTSFAGEFSFVLDNNLWFHGYLARSGRPGVASGNWSDNVGIFHPTDLYEWEVRYDDIGPNFDPGIGFVLRPDQRAWTLYGAYKPRPGWTGVRQLYLGLIYKRYQNYDGVLETESYFPSAQIYFHSGDMLAVEGDLTDDLIPYAFAIAPGVAIPPGIYANRQAMFHFFSSPSRPLKLNASYGQGGFYGGHMRQAIMSVLFKATPRLHMSVEASYTGAELPGGDFESTIARLYVSYFFSPNLITRVATQYSSLYEDFVFNFRLRWIYAPGSEAWLVYDEGHSFGLPGSSLRDRALIAKIVYNFNF